jgi:hypothetical protein
MSQEKYNNFRTIEYATISGAGIVWPNWEKGIALTGGHPALLVGSLQLLTYGSAVVEHNLTTDGAVTVGLVTCVTK